MKNSQLRVVVKGGAAMQVTRTLDEAIAQGYVVMRQSYKVSNVFFHHCESNDIPYVKIHLKTTFATVVVDLIGNSYRMSEHACREIHNLLKANHFGRWTYHLAGRNRTIMYSPRILIDNADNVARGILDILAKPGYREPQIWRSSQLVEDLDLALGSGTLLKVERWVIA
jgi:hypothetical protein